MAEAGEGCLVEKPVAQVGQPAQPAVGTGEGGVALCGGLSRRVGQRDKPERECCLKKITYDRCREV